MEHAAPDRFDRPAALVIGAGVGGLATAMRLQAAGWQVDLFERAAHPGGKMRALPSAAGPVDAGPTVLTLKPVFEDLFATCGARLDTCVTLTRQEVLARHFWPDGARLDLSDDPSHNARAILAMAGPANRRAYQRFEAETRALYDAFDGPMLQSPDPSQRDLAGAVLRDPRLIAALSPHATLAAQLARRFPDPRLAQLFGRYATYVGGMPTHAPALLALIWQAEARGVWVVEGGMARLARAMADRLVALGGRLHLDSPVARIETEGARVTGLTLRCGTTHRADTVVFNGDPRALALGHLGAGVSRVAPQAAQEPRSLSARVWSFAATLRGPSLLHHNVFFGAAPRAEFADLARGAMPADPTLYVCAQDRGTGRATPDGPERFEIILNAAPLTTARDVPDEAATCHQRTFSTLARFGLCFDPEPGPEALTTPRDWDSLFPASAGSLYGQSPHGLTASLRRPRARTPVKGLWLVGGGVHPGPGVPMAALSARHAAAAIMADRVST
ncbi:1-hydroxycarotenoid 3,4-desaturase CrtD [Pseudoponticoccus marisrubri]|uniref:Methoxyneurosporene dehydrogenase n=1 Tax=Pseudoponticoccus marisrubri TaxID=1685382 RepID=A0A0W7WHJ4_9RHOB|nr:1-hydroxycarotenoid 3,4-desaturase CrtD [Pseudoponticoccus marisrubri]KUF10015.1 methoxyneurosporene dehydrogenase [Pseudoponticoccus marisrubri]